MISDNLKRTYRDQGVNFYAFFEKWEAFDENEKRIKGLHFYIFDQKGYCWFSAYQVSLSFIKNIGNGIFLDRSRLGGRGTAPSVST